MDRVTNRVWEAHDVVPAFLGAFLFLHSEVIYNTSANFENGV